MVTCTTFRFGKAALDFPDVFLQSPDDHFIAVLGRHRNAATEPLRIENLQQGREAVGVAVVRRGRKEQAMLEPWSQVTDGPRDLRINRVLLAAGRSRVMGFVEDEQACLIGTCRADRGVDRRRFRRSAAGWRRGTECAYSTG